MTDGPHRGNKHSTFGRCRSLRLERLEDRTLLTCHVLMPCPDDLNTAVPVDIQQEAMDVSSPPVQLKTDLFAWSPSIPNSSGHLSIDVEQRSARWASNDAMLGQVRANDMRVVRWDYRSREVDRPRTITIVGTDDGALIGARVLLDPGIHGEVQVFRNSQLVHYRLSAVDLDVDTNRDGIVQKYDDEQSEDAWTELRGAMFNVNFDRDGQREADGLPLPDAIHFDNYGNAVHEDFHIENSSDELDIAPLVVRRIADRIPSGHSVVLRAAEMEDVRRIHLYRNMSSDVSNRAIWGSATGQSPPLEIDITRWVDPASPDFQGDPLTGDTTFGIEGLFFRYVGPDIPEKLHFDGHINLTLELRAADTIVSSDTVNMKVAPWIMLSRDQVSRQIWSAAFGLQGLIEHGGPGRIEDGETFSIDDGRRELTFEFDTGSPPGVDRDRVAVDIRGMTLVPQVSHAIVSAVNGANGFGVRAYAETSDLPGEQVSTTTGQVRLVHADITVRGTDVVPAREMIDDPGFRIVGMSGTTNQSLLRTELADAGYVGLDHSAQLVEVLQPDARNQWFQDHVEIGYTERPGGPKMHVAFRLPYWRGTSSTNPVWPLTELLAPEVGVFQLGVSLGGGSGDFGGNLEVLAPNSTHRLGQIVMGDRASAMMEQFLRSQEVQDPVFDLPVRWLQLGHIDEVTSFLAGGHVAIASPNLAWDLLEQIPVEDRGRSVFFASGTKPRIGVVSKDSNTPNRIETGMDHRGQPWKYLRVYQGTAAGTVAEIDELGNGFITVRRVWNTSSKVIHGSGPNRDINYWRQHRLASAPSWGELSPRSGDRYVLVEQTQFSRTGTPAVVTVAELLADDDFASLNLQHAQNTMDQIRAKLQAYVPKGELSFVELPALFYANRDVSTEEDFLTAMSVEAFNPGPANLQEAGNQLFVARQFGPRDEQDRDIFEQAIRAAFDTAMVARGSGPLASDYEPEGDHSQKPVTLEPDQNDFAGTSIGEALAGLATPTKSPFMTRVAFVDDWDLYHQLIGNVHCGTVVKREVLGFDWWLASGAFSSSI